MMLNRKIQPPVNPIEQINIQRAEKYLLSNGIPVYFVDAGTQDVIKIDFIFEAGTWFQPANLVSSHCNSMLEEGSKNYTAAEIAEKFDFFGAYLQLTVDQNQGFVSVITLTKYLQQILDVVEDVIKHPVFPEQELQVQISKNKQEWLLENEKVRTLCQKKFTQVLFGERHPYAVKNKLEDYDRITRDELVKFYQSYYHSGNCQIIMAGKVDATALQMINDRFGGTDWQQQLLKEPDYGICSSKDKFHRVEKKGSVQSAIRMGKFWVSKAHPDYHGLSILVTLLGGYFGSRLMTNIREEKGYTYGIGSYVISLKKADYLVISTEVGNEYVEPALSEINVELKRLQQELVPENELETVKSYLLGEFLRDFDGPFALSSSFKAINDFGLDYSYYDRYLYTLKTITSEEIRKLARDYLSPGDFYSVVAGAVSHS